MEINHPIGLRQQHGLDEAGNGMGRAIAAGPAIEPVEIALILRRESRAGAARRNIVQGQEDERSTDVLHIDLAAERRHGELAFELVAMGAAGDQHGAASLVDNHQRQQQFPFTLVVLESKAHMPEMLAGGGELDMVKEKRAPRSAVCHVSPRMTGT